MCHHISNAVYQMVRSPHSLEVGPETVCIDLHRITSVSTGKFRERTLHKPRPACPSHIQYLHIARYIRTTLISKSVVKVSVPDVRSAFSSTVTPCTFLDTLQLFGGTCGLHLQGSGESNYIRKVTVHQVTLRHSPE